MVELYTLKIDASDLAEVIGLQEANYYQNRVEIVSEEETPLPRSISNTSDENLASYRTLDNSPAQILYNEVNRSRKSYVKSDRDGEDRCCLPKQKWPSQITMATNEMRLPNDSAIDTSSEQTECRGSNAT